MSQATSGRTNSGELPAMLLIYRSPLLNESRIERICRAARGRYLELRFVVAGLQTGNLPSVETKASGGTFYRFDPGPRTWMRRGPLRAAGWDAQVLRRFEPENVRVVSAHSVSVLPLAARLARRPRKTLLYEPHELESHTANTPLWQKLHARVIEHRLIRECDAVICVSDSIADWYAKTYGIRRPVVVRNVPERPAAGMPEANPELWRAKFAIPSEHLVFLYQGGLFRGRRIEQLIRVFAAAKPDRHVVFMGFGELENLVQEAASKHRNIHFAAAVKPSDVLRHTAGADVGLVGVANACLSYYYSLPNKFFEFLLAGLPALMPAYPEMVRAAEAIRCGWTVGESDEEWLKAVNQLDRAAVSEAKAAARAAQGMYSWEFEQQKLFSVYDSLPGFNPAAAVEPSKR